jgi:hypothetical protein
MTLANIFRSTQVDAPAPASRISALRSATRFPNATKLSRLDAIALGSPVK